MLLKVLPLVIFAIAKAKANGLCANLDCSHTCKEEKPAPVCTCPKNLILGQDSKSCEEPVSLLLLTNKGLQLFTEGQSSNDLHSVLKTRSYAFDFYYAKKQIYAFVGDEIIRYNFTDETLTGNPSSATPVLEVDTRVTSLAVDWEHSSLYWICAQRTRVETARTDGSDHKQLASFSEDEESLANWDDIAVDPYAEKLFWFGSKGVYVSDFKGQHNIINLSLNIEHLALDINKQQIYVIGNYGKNNLGGKVVVRTRYDGRKFGEDLFIGQPGTMVYGLGVTGQKIYWESNHEGENIYKAYSKREANASVSLVEELYEIVIGVKIYKPNPQQKPKVIK